MHPLARQSFAVLRSILALAGATILLGSPAVAGDAEPDRATVLATMKRATTFMVEEVAHQGGYVWNYLPDFSRRWGELEATTTMVWFQPPGTSTMGHLFLDAYHATGDEYYYRAAERTATAVVRAQLPCGGWNYVADLAGEQSLRRWYDTVGRNAWRLEEFQHYYGNATFDDGVTAEAATFLLRLYVEKRDPLHRPALEKAIGFVLAAQHEVGAWPQRFPPAGQFSLHGRPDYTGYLTFNDAVTAGNIEFLLRCWQALGDRTLPDPIRRGMDSFLLTQGPPTQPAWALQYTPDLAPAGARSYEPRAYATHTTAASIEQLIEFYRLTGERKYMARVPEALEWLDTVRLPSDLRSDDRTHPTFLEIGTNRPLYLHREGSNVVNGRYFTNDNPDKLITHYGSFRRIDTAQLRRRYEAAAALPPAEAVKDSPLRPDAGRQPLPRYFILEPEGYDSSTGPMATQRQVSTILAGLNRQGYWPAPLHYTSHRYTSDGSVLPEPGDFGATRVGDATDTSTYPDPTPATGITTLAYIRNMGVLIRHLDRHPPPGR